MKELHIITPVKDSINTTLKTIDAVLESHLDWKYTYTIYNDYSTPENTALLTQLSREKGFTLINLSDLTSHPSPNYRLVLIDAQRKALAADAGLIIVESDVIVAPDTLQRLANGSVNLPQCGIATTVTVDDDGVANYPYLYAKGMEKRITATNKLCSFCCSLLTPSLLKAYDFDTLDASKSWYDVKITHTSRKLGFKNYLFANLLVVHHPHSSRPWKKLKHTNPLKYYFLKYVHGLDKI